MNTSSSKRSPIQCQNSQTGKPTTLFQSPSTDLTRNPPAPCRAEHIRDPRRQRSVRDRYTLSKRLRRTWIANPPARSIPSPCSTYAFNSASYTNAQHRQHPKLIVGERMRVKVGGLRCFVESARWSRPRWTCSTATLSSAHISQRSSGRKKDSLHLEARCTQRGVHYESKIQPDQPLGLLMTRMTNSPIVTPVTISQVFPFRSCNILNYPPVDPDKSACRLTRLHHRSREKDMEDVHDRPFRKASRTPCSPPCDPGLLVQCTPLRPWTGVGR